MTQHSVHASVHHAPDGGGWLATIHLPVCPIHTGGPPMEVADVLKLIRRTVCGYYVACAKAGVNDGTAIGDVINVDVEFKKP